MREIWTYSNFCLSIYFYFYFVSYTLFLTFALCDFCVSIKHGFLNISPLELQAFTKAIFRLRSFCLRVIFRLRSFYQRALRSFDPSVLMKTFSLSQIKTHALSIYLTFISRTSVTGSLRQLHYIYQILSNDFKLL